MIDAPNIGSPANEAVFLDPQVFHVCERCTACCKWPGDVRITDDDVTRMAEHLEISQADFLDQFTRLRSDRQGLSLLEKPNHECIMLAGSSCRIHPVKPSQCAGFPNKWNFPGWRQLCHASSITMAEARARDLV